MRLILVLVTTGTLWPQCEPRGELPAALESCRNWIIYAPARPFNPDAGAFPSSTELRRDLAQLAREGWRGLVTYSLDNTLGQAPCIAKEVGFTKVIAGLYWYDDVQLARERSAIPSQLACIDAFVLGNEGLDQRPRYSRQRLEEEIARLRLETLRPVATSEPFGQYISDSSLLTVGDWVFPNLHSWFSNIRSVPDAVRWTRERYEELQQRLPKGRVLVIKEAWWPTGGGIGSGEDAQIEFFRQLSAAPVSFVWGEAYDQYWKTGEGLQGPHWGFHTAEGAPKRIIAGLQPIFQSRYTPRISPSGVLHAASMRPDPIAPGLLVKLIGAGLGPEPPVWPAISASGSVPTMLAGTRVSVDGKPAPVLFARTNEVWAAIPYDVAGKGEVRVRVEFNGVQSNEVVAYLTEAAPAVFALDGTGKGQGAILNEDGRVNSERNPARPGSIVALFATGEGLTQPPGIDGKLALDILPRPRLPVSVTIGGEAADVYYAGAAPSLVAGIMQVNARVPMTLERGSAVPLRITVGDVTSPEGITMVVGIEQFR